jgi:hypothetical protein
MQLASRALLMVAMGFSGAGLASAQHELPGEMIATTSRAIRERFHLPVWKTSQSIEGRVTFGNGDAAGKVIIEWDFHAPRLSRRTSTQTVDVSFQPTAVARRAGTSAVLYVVGWSTDTGQVIVEEWTLGEYAVEATAKPGDLAVSTLVQPTITRVVKWTSDAGSLNPIWDAACNYVANELLLLESGTPTRILSLDLQSLALTELSSSDAPGHERLAGYRRLWIGKPESGGLIAGSERRPPWERGHMDRSPGTYFVLKDEDLDGAFEWTGFVEPTRFFTDHPTWDTTYSD